MTILGHVPRPLASTATSGIRLTASLGDIIPCGWPNEGWPNEAVALVLKGPHVPHSFGGQVETMPSNNIRIARFSTPIAGRHHCRSPKCSNVSATSILSVAAN